MQQSGFDPDRVTTKEVVSPIEEKKYYIYIKSNSSYNWKKNILKLSSNTLHKGKCKKRKQIYFHETQIRK